MLENIPPSVKARLLRLEKENKLLKKARSQAGQGADSSVLQTMVEDMREREEELSNKNREANKRVMELEARLEDAQASATLHVPRCSLIPQPASSLIQRHPSSSVIPHPSPPHRLLVQDPRQQGGTGAEGRRGEQEGDPDPDPPPSAPI